MPVAQFNNVTPFSVKIPMLDGTVDVTKNQDGVERAQSNVKLICPRKENCLWEFKIFCQPSL